MFGMRGRRTAGLLAAAVLLAGCAADPPDSDATSETATSPQPNPPSSIGEAAEEEVGTDWKAGPTAPVPEEPELSDQQRTEMLRLAATHPHTEDSCEAAELTGQLRYTDAATGSRYGVVLLRNDGEAPCTLQGHPGLGGRGEHGHRFHIQVEQSGATQAEQAESAQAQHSPPVRLSPGDIASADIRWGSALAGAESEWIETLYVQLTQGSTPLPVHIGERGIIDDPDEPAPDISTFTTVRIQPFEPVDQLWLQQVRELG